MTPPLDIAWFNEFRSKAAIISFSYYFRLRRKIREEQRELFLTDKVRNPSFRYMRLNELFFQSKRGEISELKERIIKQERNPIVQEAYIRRLDELIGKVDVLLAATRGDMPQFKSQIEVVYGRPSYEIFAWTLDALHDFCEESSRSSSKHITQAAHDLQSILPVRLPHPGIFIPPAETINRVFTYVRDQLGALIDMSTETEKWRGEELRSIFQKKLLALELYDWNAILTESQYYMSVEHSHKEIRIPEKRVLNRAKLLDLLVHEIGVHIVRRVRGLSSPLLLLGLGLDRYERGEEGLATLYEEAMHGEFQDIIRPERYLALGLAYGFDGIERDFRDVFEIVFQYFYLKALRAGRKEKSARRRAEIRAWETCLRIFRGTDFHTPGVCFTKDIIYQEGNIRIWETLHRYPKELLRLQAGKYDPSNERHRWILDELGIK